MDLSHYTLYVEAGNWTYSFACNNGRLNLGEGAELYFDTSWALQLSTPTKRLASWWIFDDNHWRTIKFPQQVAGLEKVTVRLIRNWKRSDGLV